MCGNRSLLYKVLLYQSKIIIWDSIAALNCKVYTKALVTFAFLHLFITHCRSEIVIQALTGNCGKACDKSNLIFMTVRIEPMYMHEGALLSTYEGTLLSTYEGTLLSTYEGTLLSTYEGRLLSTYEGTLLSTYEGTLLSIYEGTLLSTYEGTLLSTYEGTLLSTYEGTLLSTLMFPRQVTSLDKMYTHWYFTSIYSYNSITHCNLHISPSLNAQLLVTWPHN